MFAALPANAFTINEFLIRKANSDPSGITAGTDGNHWLTEVNGNTCIPSNPAKQYLMVNADHLQQPSQRRNGGKGEKEK